MDASPDVREAALRAWHASGQRGFKLRTIAERGVSRARAEPVPLVLKKFAEATNASIARVRLSFRQAVVHAVQGGRFGAPMSRRRTLLARAMESPHLLKRAGATGRGRQFPCAKVWLVDSCKAWVLTCSFDGQNVICRPKPKQEEPMMHWSNLKNLD